MKSSKSNVTIRIGIKIANHDNIPIPIQNRMSSYNMALGNSMVAIMDNTRRLVKDDISRK